MNKLLIAIIPVIVVLGVVRGLSISKKEIVAENNSDNGVDCDYITVDKNTEPSSRATVMSYRTMERLKTFFQSSKTSRAKSKSTTLRSNGLLSQALRSGFEE